MTDPIRRPGTQPQAPAPAPQAPAPSTSTPAPAPAAGAPAAQQPRDSTRLSGSPGTSRLTLPGTGALNGAKGAADGVSSVASSAQTAIGGVGQIAEGNYVEGAIAVGDGAVGMAKGAATTAKEVKTVGAALGLSEQSKLVKGADAVTSKIGEQSVAASRIAAAGGALGAAGGAWQAYKGVQEIRDGKVVEGSLDVGSGAINMVQGVGATARALAPTGQVATALGGKVVPILGVAAGGIQVAQSLAKEPPDYAKAATGAMTTVGSALMPFPPAGTVVGGALVAGAMVVDNWETISGAAGMLGDGAKEVVDGIGDGAAKVAKAAGDTVRDMASKAADRVKNFFGLG